MPSCPRCPTCLYKDGEDLGCTNAIRHEMPLTDNVPTKEPHRRVPTRQLEEFREALMDRLEAVLTRLAEFVLKLKPSKYKLLQTELTHLGHVVSKDGVGPDPSKVAT